ncbi:MAG: GIY-YIG nuclease family protein [Gemmatimonadota bacterium]
MPIDRREAARQYKESPRTYGVAIVRNHVNGKHFVFAGIDIPALVNRHRAQLKFSAHPNKLLQQEWNALGADQFTFEIVDTLAPPEQDPLADLREEVQALEAMWMEKLAPYDPNGYHRAPTARG